MTTFKTVYKSSVLKGSDNDILYSELNIQVTWKVTLCHWTSSSHCFKGP